MSNLLEVVAAHRLALHEFVDSQHELLQQALANADPNLLARGEIADDHSSLARGEIADDQSREIGKNLLGGHSLKVEVAQQSLQPTLPDDIDPLPPDVPKLPERQTVGSNEMSSLMQSELKSYELVEVQLDQGAAKEGDANRQSVVTSSTHTGAAKAFSVDDKQTILYRLDLLAGICVLVNSIFMAVELEFEGRFNGQELNRSDALPVTDPSWFFSIVDNVFAVLYFLELTCRIAVERRKFCQTAANWFDIFLATITCMDVWVLRPMALSGGATDQMILLRFMRAVKSMRAIRMVRTLRLFRGLRVLVQACYSFLPSLCWSMVLLAIFMVMGALMMGNLLQEFIADTTQDMDQREWIWQHYGTALRAMYTLYEITFAGNWPTYARPVIDGVSSYFAVFFLLYITLIVFAVIRVITAIFLKDTLDAASNDAEHLVVERMQKKAQYVKKLEQIFRAIDKTGNGMITKERMSEILEVPQVQVKAYFQTLEVEVHEGAALFHILDNGDGEVTLDEFIDGILRCKGPARAIDQVAMQADLVHLHNKLSQILRVLEEVYQSRSPRNKKATLMRRGSVAEHLRLFRGMDAQDEISTMSSFR